MKIKESMITTFDNPFDPFEQFDQWFLYDETHDYHTTSYLARIARTSDQLTDSENARQIDHAIDEIIAMDKENLYRKVTTETELDDAY